MEQLEIGIDALRKKARETQEGIVSYLLATASIDRDDRLWPADFSVFLTNPLSLSYGATGQVILINRTLGSVPDKILAWLDRQVVTLDRYPPGLFVGASGVAYCLNQICRLRRACEILDLAMQSQLLFSETCMAFGASGWGYSCLNAFLITGREEYLDHARRATEYICRTALGDKQKYWLCGHSGSVHYGYAHGSAGVGLFLLHFFHITGDQRCLEVAISALEHDIENAVETEVGIQWRSSDSDPRVYPYFYHGSAGMCAILLRYSRILGERKYRTLLDQIAETLPKSYSFNPSLFDGLTGIGELLLDQYLDTQDAKWLRKLNSIVDAILLFTIQKPTGLAFPGRMLERISNDYATGATGVGLFFDRICSGGPRLLLDLPDQKNI
jgi:hypothetical protein